MPRRKAWSHGDGDARILLGLVGLGVALGLAHHTEHIVRGDVGWPLSGEVNPFTISLVIYPAVALGFALSRRGIVGPGFWGVIAAAGAVAIGVIHFAPFTDETPDHVLDAYASTAAGWTALAIAVTLFAVLASAAAYAVVLLFRGRRVPTTA